MANITPIDKLYNIEAAKFIFQYISDTTKDLQPEAIYKILFDNAVKARNARFYDDESKVRISHLYKKGHVLYDLLNAWNTAKPELRFAGNLWYLKRLIRIEINS